jgi:hypothetical protein
MAVWDSLESGKTLRVAMSATSPATSNAFSSSQSARSAGDMASAIQRTPKMLSRNSWHVFRVTALFCSAPRIRQQAAETDDGPRQLAGPAARVGRADRCYLKVISRKSCSPKKLRISL